MLRLFKESMTRRMYDLDGEWSYLADPAGDATWGAGLPHGKKPIIIPGGWNNEPGMLHHEGDVWLETERPRYRELPVVNLESQHWPRKIAAFLVRTR